jgi:hypothetical protein
MERQLALMTDLSNEVKKASDVGKYFDPATKEVASHGSLTRPSPPARSPYSVALKRDCIRPPAALQVACPDDDRVQSSARTRWRAAIA